jgi:hypothetical protein
MDIIFLNANYLGAIDILDYQQICGWVIPKDAIDQIDIKIRIEISNHIIGMTFNNNFRPDLLSKRISKNGLGGFCCSFEVELEHSIKQLVSVFNDDRNELIFLIELRNPNVNTFFSGKLFYLHIPKTAGTSVVMSLRRAFSSFDVFPDVSTMRQNDGHYPKFESALEAMARSEYQLVLGHYPYAIKGLIKVDNVITVLRDPRERLLSHLKHIKTNSIKFADSSFEEILNKVHMLDNTQTRFLCDVRVDKEMKWNSVFRVTENDLYNALRNIKDISIVGTMCNLETFYKNINDKLGLEVANNYFANKSDSIQVDVDDDLIYNFIKFDIELYQCAKEL